jgi:hypothetical protein
VVSPSIVSSSSPLTLSRRFYRNFQIGFLLKRKETTKNLRKNNATSPFTVRTTGLTDPEIFLSCSEKAGVKLSFCPHFPNICAIIVNLGRSTLQRQNTEISKQIFPEKEYRGLSPNFHIQLTKNHPQVRNNCRSILHCRSDPNIPPLIRIRPLRKIRIRVRSTY